MRPNIIRGLLAGASIAVLLAGSQTASAVNQTWIVGGTNDNWSTSASDTNWDAGVKWTDGNTAVFNGAGEAISLTTAVSSAGLTFGGSGYNIGTANSSVLTLSAATVSVTNALDTATISAAIGGSVGLTKTGAGTLTLSGANTYSGGTTLNGGTLNLNNASNGGLGSGDLILGLGTTSTTIQNTTGAPLTISNQLSAGKSGGPFNGPALTIAGSNALTFAGSFVPFVQTGSSFYNPTFTVNNSALTTFGATPGSATLNITSVGDGGGRSLTFTGTGNTLVNSVIANGGLVANGLIKSGAGTLTLAGGNTYTGTTAVNAGSLLVNGTHTGSGAVSVTAGTLGGIGSLASAVTIGNNTGTADSFVTGGAANTIGTFTTTGALSLGSDAVYSFQLDSTGAGTADKLVANGVTLNLASTFNLTDLGAGTLGLGLTFRIIDNTGAGAITGTFAGVGQGSLLTSGANTFQVSYTGGTGNDMTLTTVPEPGALSALLGGTGVLLGLRRRRR